MITKKDSVKELRHHFSGNGFVVVQWLPQEMCHVVELHPPRTGVRAFKAWTKLLKPNLVMNKDTKVDEEVLLDPEQLEYAQEISAKLASGEYEVRSTRIVPVIK